MEIETSYTSDEHICDYSVCSGFVSAELFCVFRIRIGVEKLPIDIMFITD